MSNPDVEAADAAPTDPRGIALHAVKCALLELEKMPASRDAVRWYLTDALIALRP